MQNNRTSYFKRLDSSEYLGQNKGVAFKLQAPEWIVTVSFELPFSWYYLTVLI